MTSEKLLEIKGTKFKIDNFREAILAIEETNRVTLTVHSQDYRYSFCRDNTVGSISEKEIRLFCQGKLLNTLEIKLSELEKEYEDM